MFTILHWELVPILVRTAPPLMHPLKVGVTGDSRRGLVRGVSLGDTVGVVRGMAHGMMLGVRRMRGDVREKSATSPRFSNSSW